MSESLFDVEQFEVPLFREPRARRGAAYGTSLDARFQNDYPADWHRCTRCEGTGKLWGETHAGTMFDIGEREKVELVWETDFDRTSGSELTMIAHGRDDAIWKSGQPTNVGTLLGWRSLDKLCEKCLGMGSVKARVRLEAGHRCVRCQHPYTPKGDAKMLSSGDHVVRPSGLHQCVACRGTGVTDHPVSHATFGHVGATNEYPGPPELCKTCRGSGEVWTGWSACDERCTHRGPMRVFGDGREMGSMVDGDPDWQSHLFVEFPPGQRQHLVREAEWRVLTVHHFDGDKANLSWWNLGALCQRCHLEIQGKVVMDRVYPHEHSEWFKPYVAGFYARMYLGEELSRAETMGRLDELLGLELA